MTASPSLGLDATVRLAAQLAHAGFRVTPHLAARMFRDRAHLVDVLDALGAAAIASVFVVAGDAATPGPYADGLALLREVAELGRRPREIGIPGYPDGHPSINDALLLESLRTKAPHATYVTTQMCFDTDTITRWVHARRSEGMSLPIRIGLPGVCEPARLVAVGSRIGVRDIRRFVTSNFSLVSRLARSGGHYQPTGLVTSLAGSLDLAVDRIAGLHVYTFNSVAALMAWRSQLTSAAAG